MSCGVGRRWGLDPALLWLWRRPAATALLPPLAWEPPYAYAVGAALKRQKEGKKERKKERERKTETLTFVITWMDLEVPSDTSQRKTNITISFISGI